MPHPRRSSSVLVIGSGPIVIGQACEFDYSEARRHAAMLKEEGLRVILVNSNPATIADRRASPTPPTSSQSPGVVASIVEGAPPTRCCPRWADRQRQHSRCTVRNGCSERFNVELIGASIDAIRAGEDREEFKEIIRRRGRTFLHRPHDGGVPRGRRRIGYPSSFAPSR